MVRDATFITILLTAIAAAFYFGDFFEFLRYSTGDPALHLYKELLIFGVPGLVAAWAFVRTAGR